MTTEIILVVALITTVIALLISMFSREKAHSKQVTDLTNALVARSARDLAEIKYAERPPASTVVTAPDEVSLGELSNEQFLKAISPSEEGEEIKE